MTRAEHKRMLATAKAIAEGIDRPMHIDLAEAADLLRRAAFASRGDSPSTARRMMALSFRVDAHRAALTPRGAAMSDVRRSDVRCRCGCEHRCAECGAPL